MNASRLLGACAIGLVLAGCAAFPVTPKTIDQAALILCSLFFSAKQPQLSPADVEKAFCSTAEDIAPFLSEAKRAAFRAGIMRQGQQP